MSSSMGNPPVPPHPTVLSGHRNIVLALDKTADCEKVLKWAHDFHKDGDIFHVTHIARVLGHQDEVFHGKSALDAVVMFSECADHVHLLG